MKGDEFWYEKPEILWDNNRLAQFFPTKEMTLNEKLNSLVRISIYISLVLIFIFQKTVYLFIPIICLAFTYLIYKNERETKKESFESIDLLKSEQEKTSINQKNYTEAITSNINVNEGVYNNCVLPTPANPFMNANLISDKRDRPPACTYYDKPELAERVENEFMTNLYRDVSDLYGKNNNQREYYTMPSTTIPNDQTSFARWCYLAPPTCKEDSIRCVPYTTQPPLPENDIEYLKLNN